MATKGRIEARITIPTGGWGGTIDDSGAGAAQAWTIAAGKYYLSSAAVSDGGSTSLIAALSAALNVAATTDTITVTLSAGESGTGKVTITSTGIAAIVWTSTDLRDLLGHAGNLASGTSWAGASAAKALWLPDCYYNAPNGLDAGWRGKPVAAYSSSENPSGQVWVHVGEDKVELEGLRWETVSRARTLQAHEATTNLSWERFVKEGIWASAAWATAGGPIRVYPDAANDAIHGTYAIPDLSEIDPAHFAEGYAGGARRVLLPRLVQVPGTETEGV